MKHTVFLFLVLSLVVISPVIAEPPKIPMAVNGIVTIDGQPAVVGTAVMAHGGNNVYPGTAGVILTSVGTFGGSGAFDPRISIQAKPDTTLPEGTPIIFTVNGVAAYVRVSGTTQWGTSIPYVSGGIIYVEIARGTLPTTMVVSNPTQTPTQTPTPTPTPTVTPTPTQIMVISSSPCVPPQPEPLPPSVITDRMAPLLDCPSIPRYSPTGTGSIYVGAWGSGCMFYINDALMTSGGPATIRGIPPGTYTVSYRETGCEPQDIQVTVGQDRLVYVKVNPTPDPDYMWGEKMDVTYEVLPDRTLDTGVLTLYAFMPSGTSVYIDGVLASTTPCKGFEATLNPGIHTVRISVDEYDHEFPVMIGAGTNTKVSGGSPVVGISCARNGCDCTYLPDPYYI